MSDTARVMLTAAVLSASALSVFAWRLIQIDPSQPSRVVGELRMSQWAALLLAGTGCVPIGLAVADEFHLLGPLDVTAGVAFVLLGALVLHREPRTGLLIAALGFAAHALVDLGHRPGLLAAEAAPRWYFIGCAAFNAWLAALCYGARRR